MTYRDEELTDGIDFSKYTKRVDKEVDERYMDNWYFWKNSFVLNEVYDGDKIDSLIEKARKKGLLG